MEKNEDKWKQFSTFRQPVNIRSFNRNYFSYNPRSHGKYQNKHIGTYRFKNNFSSAMEKGMNDHHSKPYSDHQSFHRNKNEITNGSDKICPWSEEAKEEERKRKLSDTANKLLNKLKMWNTEKNEEHKRCENSCDSSNEMASSNNGNHHKVDCCRKSGKADNDYQGQLVKKLLHSSGRLRRKPHSADREIRKNATDIISSRHTLSKPLYQQTSAEIRQKRIQQNLIGELMNLPKENLKKVLVDPKIHPKIEQEMAQIVKENRLLLAQKFRSLAESKINGQGQFVCSKFVDDIGSLIDPDLAIDLCQLPPELIKQMGDIFQLDFDSGLNVVEGQETVTLKFTDNTSTNTDCSNSIGSESVLEGRKILEEPAKQDTVEGIKIEQHKLENIPSQCSLEHTNNTSTDMECTNSVGSELMPEVSKIKEEPPSEIIEEIEIEEHKLGNLTSQYPFELDNSLSGACSISNVKLEPGLLNDTCYGRHSEQKIRVLNETIKTEYITENVIQGKVNDSIQSDQAQCVNVYNDMDNIELSEKSTNSVNKVNFTVKSENVIVDNDNQCSNFDYGSGLTSEILKSRTCCQNEAEDCTWTSNNCENGEGNRRVPKQESSKSPIYCGNSFDTCIRVDNENGKKQNGEKRSECSQSIARNCMQFEEAKKSIEVQTDINLIDVRSSKAFQVQERVEEGEKSLLEEVETIDNLIHMLNQRRFLLFLKLIGLPNCKSRKNKLLSSLIQAVTNGDFKLMKEIGRKGWKSYGLKVPPPTVNKRRIAKTRKCTPTSQNGEDVLIIETVEKCKQLQKEDTLTNCLNCSQNNSEKPMGRKRTLAGSSRTEFNFSQGKRLRGN